MTYTNPNTGCKEAGRRFAGGISLDGNIVVKAYTEILRETMSPMEWITMLFDGSNEVRIINKYRTDIVAVPISDARRVPMEEYGVSFKKEWQEPICSMFL